MNRTGQDAGRLTSAHWIKGHLSKAALLDIAEAVDEKGFTLKEELQPSQPRIVAAHNQECTHKPIKTFHAAAGHLPFVRLIRRRLYVARDKYEKSQMSVSRRTDLSKPTRGQLPSDAE
ncbi:MAG TPA: hypothetical protein VFA15_02605 [Nitrososphaera sp.]|nr:hypothetical protein [Nitrososphaera sp.]